MGAYEFDAVGSWVESLKPQAAELSLRVYPNPVSRLSIISYHLPESAHVMIGVYDMTGRKITVLVSGTRYKGEHELTWNAMDTPPGLYFINFRANGQSVTEKIIVR